MADMKLIMENWRSNFLVEEGLETVGDLIKIIKIVKRDKTLKAGGKLIAKIATGGLIDIDQVGDVTAFIKSGLDTGDFGRALYGGDLSNKKQPIGLQSIAVDPDVSRIVDNDIEKAFLKYLSKKIEQMDPNTSLNNIDTTKMLQDFIAANFNNKTVKE